MVVIVAVPLRGVGRLAHVDSRSGGVGTLRNGVVYSDPPTVDLQVVALLLGLQRQETGETAIAEVCANPGKEERRCLEVTRD